MVAWGIKIAFFAVFFGLVTIALGVFKAWLMPYLDFGSLSSNVLYILCRTGFFTALNIYLTALLAIYVVNNVIGYARSGS